MSTARNADDVIWYLGAFRERVSTPCSEKAVHFVFEHNFTYKLDFLTIISDRY